MTRDALQQLRCLAVTVPCAVVTVSRLNRAFEQTRCKLNYNVIKVCNYCKNVKANFQKTDSSTMH